MTQMWVFFALLAVGSALWGVYAWIVDRGYQHRSAVVLGWLFIMATLWGVSWLIAQDLDTRLACPSGAVCVAVR